MDEGLNPKTHRQLRNSCRLPLANGARHSGHGMEQEAPQAAQFLALCSSALQLSRGTAPGPRFHPASQAESRKHMSHSSANQPMQVKEAYRLWAPEYDSTPNPLLSLEQRFLWPLTRSAQG